ncbi:hypothetical protein, partial [Enterococcus faecalis]|uniref:hypothetical protein n=1 Tax=Enterococcus faecalis TaxID=1351 RepID=UPI00403F6CB0
DFLNEHDLNPEMAEENDRQQAQINQQLMMMGQAAAAAAAVNGNMNQMEESIDNCPRNFFHYNNIVSNENAGGFADELPQP